MELLYNIIICTYIAFHVRRRKATAYQVIWKLFETGISAVAGKVKEFVFRDLVIYFLLFFSFILWWQQNTDRIDTPHKKYPAFNIKSKEFGHLWDVLCFLNRFEHIENNDIVLLFILSNYLQLFRW